MTISIISDLHCRNKSFPPSFDASAMKPADVLVVAGDLATHVGYEEILSKLKEATSGKFGTVICVKGNHDYYVTDDHWLRTHELPEGPCEGDNFVVTVDEMGLSREKAKTVDFICTPMWSPITNHGIIAYMMNDYAYIPKFSTDKCTELFGKNLSWLESETTKSAEAGHMAVIVTHHLPVPELIDENYKDSEVNEAFCVLDESSVERIRKIRCSLWIHGHSHNFCDKTVRDTRYVRNPYGYEWKTHRYALQASKENTGYVKDFIVEI